MSLRYFSVRLFRNGRYFLQKYLYTGKQNVNISEESISKGKLLLGNVARSSSTVPQSSIRSVGQAVGFHARRLLVENVLCKVNNGFNTNIKKQVTRRFFFGDSAPLFAFLGVSLASGSGFISRQDELEGLCLEIRNAVLKFQTSLLTEEDEPVSTKNNMNLSNLNIGNIIAMGCSAAVYEANVKNKVEIPKKSSPTFSSQTTNNNADSPSPNILSDISEFPLALKMMFNFDVQSSSLAIHRAMFQETVPARRFYTNNAFFCGNLLNENKLTLPPHPNIIAIYSVFADYVPKLPGSLEIYPDALPSSINPEGSGRNMTLFLLMKRYQYSLAEYLMRHPPMPRNAVLLFTQLLEGIVHMNRHGIAHRDLKSDNILVDHVIADDDDCVPILVITDFGCCIADKTFGLKIPYMTDEIPKGGNMALMAPEVILQKPGMFSSLDYSKSDLWAAGAIAYEIFGYHNPFYNKQITGLQNFSFHESQLPCLKIAPTIIRKLIENILSRNPNKRVTPEVAANICQLFLWAPSAWIQCKRMPNNTEILQWLFCLTTKILCEGRLSNQTQDTGFFPQNAHLPFTSAYSVDYSTKKSARRTHPEYILISNFLCRAKLQQIKQALTWIHANDE